MLGGPIDIYIYLYIYQSSNTCTDTNARMAGTFVDALLDLCFQVHTVLELYIGCYCYQLALVSTVDNYAVVLVE